MTFDISERMADLNYRHLRYFRAVAHEGNLTRAARLLNLSQSALSAQIRDLEQRLGHALFERRGRRLQLTEAGRIALDHADVIFAAGDELLATLQQNSRASQSLRIGALATLSRNFQINFLRPLLGSGVRIVLRSGTLAELLADLETLQLDVVLLNLPPPADRGVPLVAHKLAEQTVSLVGAPADVGPRRDLPSLLDKPLILPSPGSSIRLAFDALAARVPRELRIVAEADDMAMIRLLARERAGIAVIPPIVVRDELESGLLTEAIRLPELSETFYAVTMRRRFPNPHIDSLLAHAPPCAPDDPGCPGQGSHPWSTIRST